VLITTEENILSLFMRRSHLQVALSKGRSRLPSSRSAMETSSSRCAAFRRGLPRRRGALPYVYV
jgi:hypothetical protein